MVNQEIAQRAALGFLLLGGVVTFAGSLLVYFYKKGKMKQTKYVKSK